MSDRVLLRVEVDALPDMRLVQNQRRKAHWSEQASATKEAAAVAYFALRAAGLTEPLVTPLHLIYTVHFDDNRARDLDGIVAALKPWTDVLTPSTEPVFSKTGKLLRSARLGLGVVPDDQAAYIPMVTYRVAQPEPVTTLEIVMRRK